MNRREMDAYRAGRESERAGSRRNGRRAVHAAGRRAKARRAGGHYTILAAICIAAVLITCFLVFGMTSNAQSEDMSISYKYYKSVVITEDEGVMELAEKYADPEHYADTKEYIAEICRINHYLLLDEAVQKRPGDRLIIPYYSEEYR